MLPPINASVLQSNPKFAALYTTLNSQILNLNGSTKKHPAQKERDAVSEELHKTRLCAAKSHLLTTALSSLDLTPAATRTPKSPTLFKPLPPELIQLILLLSARLSSPASTSSTALLESTPQWDTLNTHLPAIGGLVSTNLHNQALALARVQNPSTNASYLHRAIPRLAGKTRDLQREVEGKKTELEARRIALVTQTTTVLSLTHQAITLIIRILEQSKHGALSRQLKLKSEFLSLSGEMVALEGKEKMGRAERAVYTDAVRGALGNYVRNLRDGRERLGERERDARRLLWGYGVGREDGVREKERVMREVARVYGELIREVKEVGRDVERLRGK